MTLPTIQWFQFMLSRVYSVVVTAAAATTSSSVPCFVASRDWFFPRAAALPVFLRSSCTGNLSIMNPALNPEPRGIVRQESAATDISSSVQEEANRNLYHLFIDLDGVLVDFEQGVLDHCQSLQRVSTKKDLESVPPGVLFSAVGKVPNFYADKVGWMPDGKTLWTALIKDYRKRFSSISILSGIPISPKSARHDKFTWCQRELVIASSSLGDQQVSITCTHVDKAGPKYSHGEPTFSGPTNLTKKRSNGSIATFFGPAPSKKSKTLETETDEPTTLPSVPSIPVSTSIPPSNPISIPVITCWSKNKHMECLGSNYILIDDRAEKLQGPWEAAGGIFIHHTSTDVTLTQLRKLNILE
jgi:hypothetical protein